MAQLDTSGLVDYTPGQPIPTPNAPATPSAPPQIDTSGLVDPGDYKATKQAEREVPEPNRWQQLGGALLKGIPVALQGMGEAMERGERMGMMPGMDLIAGMLQPAIAGLTHQAPVPTPITSGGAEQIGKLASAAHVNPWDYFPDPAENDPLGQIITAGGEGATGMLVPFGGEEAAGSTLLTKGLAKLGDMAKQMGAGFASGIGAQTAATFAPEPAKPAAALVGGLLGGVGGNFAMEAPGIVGRSLKAAGDYMAPISRSNTQKLAAARIAPYVSDIEAAKAGLAGPGEIIPGDQPTAAEQSGDVGLTMFQRSLARTDPEFRQQLLQRTEEQNTARTQFLEDLQREGAPGAVADAFRGQMDQLTQRADQLYQQAETQAQQQYDSLGNPIPAQVGDQARTAMSNNFKALNAQANALYKSIPDDLHAAVDPLVNGTARLYGAMSPEEKLTMLPSEQALAGVIGNYGPAVPFSRLRQLTSAINTAMREARQAPNGGMAYGRLTQLRGLIDDTMDASIAKRVAEEQTQVANGTKAPEDTLAAQFLHRAEEWNGPSAQTATPAAGYGLDTGNAVPTSEQETVLPRPTGAGSDLGRGPAGPQGNQGLPQNAGEQVNAGQGSIGAGGVRPSPASPEAQLGTEGRQADGSLQGLPRKAGNFTASAYPEGQRVARDYMAKAGLDYAPPNTYQKVDPARAKRIADAYEAMPHDPNNPEVKRAYRAMIDETKAQYQAMLDNGMKIDFIPPDAPDPYQGNPRNMIEDVRNNKHMWVYSTKAGFGSDATFDPVDNPLLEDSGFKISGQPATVNDIFRAVHDYFGHVKEGVGFRADGEENAWRAHSAMYSPLARKAMTSETRGQNSWVNFGPYGETNRTARSEDTHYADQKIGILPDWAIHEGAGDPSLANTVAERFASAGRTPEEGRALGALTDAFYKSMGISPEQFPLPEVTRANAAPEGALYQQERQHPAIEFMRQYPNNPISTTLRQAYDRDPNPDHIPLTIDNDHNLYDYAKANLAQMGISPDEIDEAGGVGNALMNRVRESMDRIAAEREAAAAKAPTVPTFYSAAERAVTASKNNKANADQWLATIKNTPGIKQEELDWLGLEPWLREQKDPISKDEVAQFIRDNSLEVSETDLSGTPLDQEFDRIEWEPLEPDDDYLRENIYPGSWSHDKAKEDVAQERNDNAEEGTPEVNPEDIPDDDPEVMDKALEYERDIYNEEPEYTSSLDYGGITFSLSRGRDGEVEIYDTTNHEAVTNGYLRLDDADIQSAIRNYMAENGYGDSEGGDGSTKYHEYAEHGGEDYHELLLTLPERTDAEYTRPSYEVQQKYKPQWDALAKQINDASDAARLARLRQVTDGSNGDVDKINALNALMEQQDALHRQMVQETMATMPPWARGRNFTRSHWDDPNVVAHVRFDTRNVGGKRTLFLQEIQSDWHQQGRERGYASGNMEERRAKAQEELDAAKKDWNDVLAEHVEKHKPAGTLASDFMDMGEPSPYKIKRALRNQYDDAVTYWMGRQDDPAAKQAIFDAESAQAAHEKAINALYESDQYKQMKAAQTAVERLDPYHVVPDAPFKTTWPELTLKRMIRWAAEKGYDQIAWTPGDLQNGSIVTQAIDRLNYIKRDDGNYHVNAPFGPSDWAGDKDHSNLSRQDVVELFGEKVASQMEAGEGADMGAAAEKYGPKTVRQIALENPRRVGGDIQYYYGKVLPGIASKLVKKFGSDVYRTPMNIAGERISAVTIPINEKMRETALHEGLPLFQSGQRGAIQFGQNGKSLISLLKNADASTGVHELAHWFLQNYGALANDANAPAHIRGDWQTTKNWWRKNADAVATDAGGGTTADHVRSVLDSGTTGDQARDDLVHRGLHEQWARAFETYMREGKAPTPGLQRVFERFKQWLGQVYRTLTGLNVKLSPEMRGVFDRMLGGEAPTEAPQMIDEAARQKYRQAAAMTKNIKETFTGRGNPVAAMLKRSGSSYAYDMSDESLAGKLWRPGADGVNTINRVLRAAGNAPDAHAAIEQAAIMSLKNSATAKDGLTLDPNKFATWRAKHAEALQALPELDRRFQTASEASKTMQRVADARQKAIASVQKTAVGKLLGVRGDADVISTVGSMLNSKNAVTQMRELVSSAKSDPAAMDGLRKAVVDHMMGKLKSNTVAGGFKNATFQNYLGRHAAALSEVLSPEQMNGLRALAQTIKRASKDTRAPGGGSDTLQNINDQAHFAGHRTLLGLLLEKAGELAVRSGVSLGIGHLVSPLAGLGAWLAESTINAARQAGLKRVDDLVRAAVLNPELMADLLKQAPKQKGTGSEVNLARTLGKLAFTAGNMAQRQP